ncbi:hypothetical protein EVG20_g6845 [Dentipellis fragilis]|uniref:Uncharacterized protein n=1 Tax=Dentipellis fragilis TaxID=205917 RepID=A0A4Y9YHN0_9AGAM|nr:hypothetical protein EVG20_g6845 [Dentipellis fragilis]
MKFTNAITSSFVLVSAALSSLTAAVPLSRRDVYAPRVTSPHNGTVWTFGQRYNVTWDTSDAPQRITNPIGQIKLGRDNIIFPITLASNFSVLDGRIEVAVPNVDSGDYNLVFFGDSGDNSEVFTITNTNSN